MAHQLTRQNKHWTYDEAAFLEHNYHRGPGWCAYHLGRTTQSVSSRACLSGITDSAHKAKHVSPEKMTGPRWIDTRTQADTHHIERKNGSASVTNDSIIDAVTAAIAKAQGPRNLWDLTENDISRMYGALDDVEDSHLWEYIIDMITHTLERRHASACVSATDYIKAAVAEMEGEE